MKRSISLENSNGQVLVLTATANVMGKTRGTPALRTGIKVVHVHADAMSDASDWQGFES